ncbi:hypothetical protein TGMAS_205390 [Toxoplasma gondii MAS]|uniref:Uncharacterized protein n=2 Tax=Toxoplasma gondii TaxID=5811 RepID=A0A086Q4N9_TOXGO|nr:hypothetical protein TGMAS_205390 [Toxoplasma gondii MAS]PUA85614.1 hypothetical protein TGBR9_205390 [Toxoplasma gondii TgCATBr9]
MQWTQGTKDPKTNGGENMEMTKENATKYQEVEAVPKTGCDDLAAGAATSEVQEKDKQREGTASEPEFQQDEQQEPERRGNDEERMRNKGGQQEERKPLLDTHVPAGQRGSITRVRAFDSEHAEQSTQRGVSSSTEKTVVLEYEPIADQKTQKSGYGLLDSMNNLLDNWLVPGEDTGEDPPNIVTPQPVTEPTVTRIVEYAPQNRCQGEEALNFMTTLGSLRVACPLADLHETHPACPACHQPLPGDKRPPTHSWTRWLFKQCEEPLDIQSEFLVYPNPLLYAGRRQVPNIDEPWFGTISYVPS